MAFNATTYRANKTRKMAWENLARAREIKARAERGEAYDWELPRIAFFVKAARSDMRGYLLWKEIRSLQKQGHR